MASTTLTYHSSPRVSSSSPLKTNIAFVFNLNHITLSSTTHLRGMTETLNLLVRQKIPFLLVPTTSYTSSELQAAVMNKKFHIRSIDARQVVPASRVIIATHPFAKLVPKLAEKNVLVIGGSENEIREEAFQLGFTKVITTSDIFKAQPWPNKYASSLGEDHHNRIGLPLPTEQLKIEAVLVFDTPRDWLLDLEVVMEVLLSEQRSMGTEEGVDESEGVNTGGYRGIGQPKLFFSHVPDHSQPRKLTQRDVAEALNAKWRNRTQGSRIKFSVCGRGKAKQILNFDEVEKQLEERNEVVNGRGGTRISTVYLVDGKDGDGLKGFGKVENVGSVRFNWKSIGGVEEAVRRVLDKAGVAMEGSVVGTRNAPEERRQSGTQAQAPTVGATLILTRKVPTRIEAGVHNHVPPQSHNTNRTNTSAHNTRPHPPTQLGAGIVVDSAGLSGTDSTESEESSTQVRVSSGGTHLVPAHELRTNTLLSVQNHISPQSQTISTSMSSARNTRPRPVVPSNAGFVPEEFGLRASNELRREEETYVRILRKKVGAHLVPARKLPSRIQVEIRNRAPPQSHTVIVPRIIRSLPHPYNLLTLQIQNLLPPKLPHSSSHNTLLPESSFNELTRVSTQSRNFHTLMNSLQNVALSTWDEFILMAKRVKRWGLWESSMLDEIRVDDFEFWTKNILLARKRVRSVGRTRLSEIREA